MQDGVFISLHTELLSLTREPHVYISRRALKHFVERRKVELLKNRSINEVVNYMIMIGNHMIETVESPDTYKRTKEKIVYEKAFSNIPNLSLRVVAEEVDNHQEIKSIHPLKNKNTTN